MKNKQIVYVLGSLLMVVGAMLIDGHIWVTGCAVFGIGLLTVIATPEIGDL